MKAEINQQVSLTAQRNGRREGGRVDIASIDVAIVSYVHSCYLFAHTSCAFLP